MVCHEAKRDRPDGKAERVECADRVADVRGWIADEGRRAAGFDSGETELRVMTIGEALSLSLSLSSTTSSTFLSSVNSQWRSLICFHSVSNFIGMMPSVSPDEKREGRQQAKRSARGSTRGEVRVGSRSLEPGRGAHHRPGAEARAKLRCQGFASALGLLQYVLLSPGK